MSSLDEIRSRFSRDLFATALTGIEIREAEAGRAVCDLPLRPEHMNANNVPMGGVIFTIADFTFALAANAAGEGDSVTQHVSITFLSPARGTLLTAEARSIRDGRTTCLYEVDVRDDLGTHVAHATVNGFHISK